MIQMMPGKCAVKLDPPDEKIGMIYVPDNARDNCNLGTIVSCNTEPYWHNFAQHTPKVKVGDRVLVGRYSGVDLVYNGEELKILQQSDILALIPSDQTPPASPLGISVSEDVGVASS